MGWEHQQRANWDYETMRAEFRERLYKGETSMGMALPDAHRNLGANGYCEPTEAAEPTERSQLQFILGDVGEEVQDAIAQHGDFHSFHEAYGVLAEEVDEFWDEVKLKASKRVAANIRKELIQVAAVAVKTILCLERGFAVDKSHKEYARVVRQRDELRDQIGKIATTIGYCE